MSKNVRPKDVAVWFEIPAANFERAAKFYETLFETKLVRETFDNRQLGMFPFEKPDITGCVIEASNLAGRDTGTVVYLNCDGRLDQVAGRVESAGGKLLTPRIELPGDQGAFFQIRDSEGNRVGLHAVA